MSLPDAVVAVVRSGPLVLMIRRGPGGPDAGYWVTVQEIATLEPTFVGDLHFFEQIFEAVFE